MIFSFLEYELDEARAELRKAGTPLRVEPQVFELLRLLINNRDRVVTKDEIYEAIWNNRFVSEAALSSRVRDARKAIGDDGTAQALIRTVQRRGLRFVADVAVNDASASSANTLPNSSSSETDAMLRPDEDRPSIAVMPFKNLSHDKDQDYFVDGVCEDIISALSLIKWLFVTARNSTFSYKDAPRDVQNVAAELGVRYLVDGSIRRDGDRARISVHLLDGTSANHIWSERFDLELKDIFAVQDQITERIVATLEAQLSVAEGARSKRKTEQNLDAWDLVIRAMALKGDFTNDSSIRALELLDRAIGIDPTYARAYSQIAWTTAWRIHQGWEDADTALPKAIEAAEKAVKFDPDEPWAYIAWLFIATITKDAEMLVESAKSALQINPNFAMAHSWLGAAYALAGQGDKSLAPIERARLLSPRDMFKDEFEVHTSYAYFQMGDYKNACVHAFKASLPRPDHVYPRLVLATSLAHLGDMDGAERQADKIMQLVPEFSLCRAESSCVFTMKPDIDRFIEGLRKAGIK